MNPVSITVTIITLNEAKNIARCIDSIIDIADEIVVVDSKSTDRTKEIATTYDKVRFLEHPFEGHIQQKNYAVSQATYDYILALDADEAVDPTLKESILSEKANWTQDTYKFNRLTNYSGQWIKHCGWYPDQKVRLFDRKQAAWGGTNPHDKIIYQGSSKPTHLKGDLLHYSFPNIAAHANTVNQFSTIAAEESVKRGRKIYFLIHIVLNPLFTFFKGYIINLGFLDGFYGLVICTLSSYANFLKYAKIWSLSKHGQ